MTQPLQTFLQSITVHAAEDLHPYWKALMGDGGFARRTLWVGVIDSDDHPTPVVAQIDDVPQVPHPADLDALGRVLGSVADAGTPVCCLSRPGFHGVRGNDRRWARALAPVAPRWPLHLATADRSGQGRLWVVQ